MSEKVKKISTLVFLIVTFLYVFKLAHYNDLKSASSHILGIFSVAKAEDDERENEENEEYEEYEEEYIPGSTTDNNLQEEDLLEDDSTPVEDEDEAISPESEENDEPEGNTPLEIIKNDESSSAPALNTSDTSVIQPEEDSTLVWYITRSAGVTSYILMFLMVVMGEGMTSGLVYKFVNPIRSWVIHKYLGIMLGVALLIHMVSLLFDKFVIFGWADILIPFHSDFEPIFLSLGIAGFYFLAVIVLSSLFFRERYSYVWRRIHWLVYPLFIMGLIHGLFVGTDSHTLTMQIIYWSTGIIFLLVLAHRWTLAIARMKSWKGKTDLEDLYNK